MKAEEARNLMLNRKELAVSEFMIWINEEIETHAEKGKGALCLNLDINFYKSVKGDIIKNLENLGYKVELNVDSLNISWE